MLELGAFSPFGLLPAWCLTASNYEAKLEGACMYVAYSTGGFKT